uniref:Immunoglobulin I-set domain protein n=1 Tax=Syphacia muris TaxID=451379 RepID=A0A0N5ALN4_9BILA
MPFKRPLGERAENQNAPNFIRPLQDKRVVVGQNVVLECQVAGHPEPVVKWLKDGQNVTQCPDYEITSDGVRHRLSIRNVEASDSGRFTIQAMNAAGTKQSTCTLIAAPAPTPIPGVKSVASSPAPPQTPVGPSAPLFLKELKHQPLKPGYQVVLEARVAGNPTPQVEWLMNGAPLKNYRARTEYDPQTGICALIIPQMFADDIGEYICRATNSHGVGETSAHLLPGDEYERWFHNEQTQITRERKENMLAQSRRIQSSYFSKVTLTDAEKPGEAPKQYENWKPATVAQRQMQRWSGNGGSSGRSSTNDFLWGVSESETEPELAAVDSRNIGRPPILQTPLKGLRLTEGTDAILQCSIVGNPKPTIEWLKNGKVIDPTSSARYTVTHKGSLAILKISMVAPEDSGMYTILARNNFGKVKFMSLHQNIKRYFILISIFIRLSGHFPRKYRIACYWSHIVL